MADVNEIRGDALELEVNGARFSGWESMSVTRQLESVSGAFRVQASRRSPWPIVTGDEVTVTVADEVVLTGFVDEVSGKGDARSTTFVAAGRDRTADLVDCSETSEPGEFANIIVQDLVAEIAQPFGLEVRSTAQRFGQEPFARFKVNTGESAWTAIERACRLRGLLCFSDGDGALIVSKPATRVAQADLVVGGANATILSWNFKASTRQRFQTYTVKGQRRGSDDAFGGQVAQVFGTAQDPEISRFRPLVVTAEGVVTFENATDRAQYEASFRAARAATLNVVVQGWRQIPETGRVWRVNELVGVDIPAAQIDAEMLVKSVQFKRDKSTGSTTTLVLTRKDAYDPAPVVEPRNDPFGDLVDRQEVPEMADLVATLQHYLAPLLARVKNLVARGSIAVVNDAPMAQEVQVDVLAGEVLEGVENLAGLPGVTSYPQAGAEVVVVGLGGNRDHPIVVAVNDRASRPKAEMAEGDVIVYHATSGARIWIKADGSIEIPAPGGITITGDVTISGNLDVGGNVTAAGEVQDAVRTMAADRLIYNSHTHKENGAGGGLTNPPFQMQ